MVSSRKIVAGPLRVRGTSLDLLLPNLRDLLGPPLPMSEGSTWIKPERRKLDE
jgi:hypothetical protein